MKKLDDKQKEQLAHTIANCIRGEHALGEAVMTPQRFHDLTTFITFGFENGVGAECDDDCFEEVGVMVAEIMESQLGGLLAGEVN